MILTPRHCGALMMAAFHVFAQLLASIYGVFALKCSACGGWLRLPGFLPSTALCCSGTEKVSARWYLTGAR